MKKLLLIVAVTLAFLPAKSQSDCGICKGDFEIDAGSGLSLYFFHSNISFGEGLGAAAVDIDLNLKYSLKQDFYIGLGGKVGTIITDNEIQGADTIPTTVVASTGNMYLVFGYYFVNRPKFVSYVGSGIGVSTLYYEETENENKAYFNAGGSSFKLDLGIKKLFNNWFGMYAQASFSANPVTLTELHDGTEFVDRYRQWEVNEIRMSLRGISLNAGFTFNF